MGDDPLSRFDQAKVDLLKQHLARVLEYDAHSYIVGHGPVAKPEHIRRWLAYLDDLLARVPPLARQGKDLDEIEAAVPVPGTCRTSGSSRRGSTGIT